MSGDTEKLNRLGYPIKRTKGARFAKGNQEGKQFGRDVKSFGRPEGTKNICTIIKNVALAHDHRTGMSNIEWIVKSMIDAKIKLKDFVDNADPTTKGYANALANYAQLSGRIMEQLAKYSGDYTAKFQAEISDQLSEGEKEIMEKVLTNAKKK